ncbi:hypothetical protein [Comamonas sp. JUb58]|uniref:hypothetical protein n=1 Tax=Comamonas sp. JUb58 TaxID=2485114 RepID=UPI00106002C0|nr:hypothetical protein [Comamonas sp. JUb58]TDS73383.1 hypothetical protein EDF71_12157 [Comamonas sp. JUb58]
MEAVRNFEYTDLPGYYGSIAAPGSQADLDGRQRVGVDLYVLPLQFCGTYLCSPLLTVRAPIFGVVISSKTPFNGYQSAIYKRSDLMKLVSYPLEQVEVWKKREDGTMLLRGEQWDEGELNRWPQTWICGRNPSAVTAALRGMSAWLDREYAKVKRPPYANDRPR